MKNKVFIISNLILTLALVVILSGFIFGWYVNSDKSQNVDVITDGIILSYTFDDRTTVNETTYEVDNLVFFDLDNEKEGKYFTSMAVLMQINIENKGSSDVNITVSQGMSASEDPYVATAVSTSTLDSSDATGSVEDFLGEGLKTSATVSNVSAFNEATNVGGMATFYVYIYGIQPNDDATNEFLGNYTSKAKYTFSIVISARSQDDTTTTTTTN